MRKKQWMILPYFMKKNFYPSNKVKIQAPMELMNYQPTAIIELKIRRIWMTDVYTCKFFNEFVRHQIKNDLMKRESLEKRTCF